MSGKINSAAIISRRAFLNFPSSVNKMAIRPPWAIADQRFTEVCTRCGECLAACPERVLKKDGDGYPTVDLESGPCTLCQACVTSCKTGAISLNEVMYESLPWSRHADITDSCLIKGGMDCRNCIEDCPQQAIGLSKSENAGVQIRVDQMICHGCGVCESHCPVQAISMLQDNQGV